MAIDQNVASSSATGAASAPKRRGRGKKIVLIVLGLLVVVVVGLVLAAPTIASSIAPGKIEQAANEQIKGKVKVGGLSIGWFSPTTIGPVEIIDPEGKTAARATIAMPATLWRIVSERWWSATKLDVGEVNVSGGLDLIRDSGTGVTNLQRALEPRVAAKTAAPSAAASKSGGAGGGLESVKAAVKITQFDAVVRDRDAAGKLSAQQGVKDLKGTVNLDYAARPMSIAAATDLSATPVGGGTTDAVKIKLDSSVSMKAAGGLDAFKVKGDVAGAPMGLIDALAGQGGALVQGIGTRADLHVDASGTAQAAMAKVALQSAGAKADLDVALKDGVLSAAQATQGASGAGGASNTISLKSTEFLASMPALRAALAKAGEQVKLDNAPGIEITIENLRVPLPPEALNGGDAKGALAKADLRGSGMDLKVHVDKMSGKVMIDQPQPGAGGAGSTAGGANGSWKSFAVDPVDITLNATDLSKPVTITGGTKATIDNAPAGDLSVRATGAGLLDQAGHLRALGSAGGMADDVDADVRVHGMSTALIAPIVAGMGMAVDLKQDVGPTLDLGVQAKADVKGVKQGDAGLPPVDFTVSIASSNVKVDGTGRYAAGVVSVTGNGLAMSVNSAAPLAQRILAKPGQSSVLEISGAGTVQVKVTEFSAPVNKLSGADAVAAIKAAISVDISSLGVKPAGLPAEQPVQVQKMSVGVRLDGSNPPRVDLSSTLSHAGAPFEMTGQLTLDGITGGKLPASGAGAAQIVAFKPSGKVEIKSAPRSLANLVPGAALAGTEPTGPGSAVSPLAAAVRESIGKSITLTLTTQPDGAAQGASIKLASAAGGLGADVAAKLTDKAITIGTLSAFASMDPKVVNPVLAAANANTPPGNTAPGVAGTPGVQPPIQLGQPFKLSVVSGGAITVPLKPGTFEPDLAGASDLAVKLSTDNDIAINNVPTGADSSGAQRTTSVLVRALACDVKAPLSGLANTQDATKRLSATFSAKAVRGGGGDGAAPGGAMIADISGSATATMQGANPDATVKIASIDCAVVENLLGQRGLLTGGLGEKADAELRVQPAPSGGASVTTISATITAPKVSDAKIDLAMSADRMAITKPATITWRPDPAFLNKMVFPPTPGAQGKPATPSAISVTQASPVTITINKLSLATTQFKDGQITAGPLKPGVFDLDASIAAPSLAMTAMSQGGGGPPTPITLDGLKVAVRQQQVTSPAASGGKGAGGAAPAAPAAGGEILATLSIDKVTTTAAAAPAAAPKGKGAPAPIAPAPQAAAKSSTINAHITNLADAIGVIDQKKAIVNLDMDVAAFPTPILDQLGQQKGVLVELLGPTLDAQAQARNVSLGAGQGGLPTGSIQLKASSPRASAEVNGNVANGTFVQTGPVSVKITQITPQLVQSLAGAIPLVESVEKTPPDAPATLDGSKLTIPLDGNMAKLSGDAQIDPGVARFTSKPIFADLIGALGGKSKGAVGERIAAFKVHADKGVLTYDQFTLPVGQFSVQTKGTVDMVRRQIDVVTYAPIGSLTTKALGQLDTGIAGKLGIFDKTTMVPITTKGPLDNPKTELDLGLFAKEQANKLTKDPGKLIGNVLDDLLNKKKGK